MNLVQHLERVGETDLSLNTHWFSNTGSRYNHCLIDPWLAEAVGIRAHDDILMEEGVEGYSWSALWDLVYEEFVKRDEH